MSRTNWSRDELIIAFNLYCKIPFGKNHIGNPLVIALANALGRTPSAVSWKLANFASLDPALKRRAIRGASHNGRLDQQIWDEFNGDWNRLSLESERLLAERVPEAAVEGARGAFPNGGSRPTMVEARVNQSFFRSAVLAAYGNRCCITRLPMPALLNASHIVPWRIDLVNRTNPRNGLCLNALHDRAFDLGLITVTPDYRVRVSPQLNSGGCDPAMRALICCHDGNRINLPARFEPDQSFLDYHNQHVFRS